MKYAAVKTNSSLARMTWPALCLCAIAYFVFHILSGQYGLLALNEYQDRKPQLLLQADDLARERARLENRIALMDQAALDPDLAEELVRQDLGYVRSDEILIPVTPER